MCWAISMHTMQSPCSHWVNSMDPPFYQKNVCKTSWKQSWVLQPRRKLAITVGGVEPSTHLAEPPCSIHHPQSPFSLGPYLTTHLWFFLELQTNMTKLQVYQYLNWYHQKFLDKVKAPSPSILLLRSPGS